MTQGQRVNTPVGAGTVAYVRMGGPNYSTPEAVSVRLDKIDRPGYSGSMFPIDQVTVITADPGLTPST